MHLKHEDGQDLVEYALVLPLLLLLIFGIIEFSLILMAYVTIANSARDGVRAGILPPTTACNQACRDAQMVTAAEALTVGLDPAALTIATSRPTAITVRVQVEYDAPLLVLGHLVAALGGTTSVPLLVVATMQVE